MDISVKDLHNDMKKPSGIGGLDTLIDYVTQKLLIIDTTLKSFIPPQVCKMTHKLRHICGCKVCIIPKDMQIYLNIFRTRLVTYYNRSMLVDKHATFYLGLHVMHITKIFSPHMMNVYMLLSKMLPSESPIFLLNQRM